MTNEIAHPLANDERLLDTVPIVDLPT